MVFGFYGFVGRDELVRVAGYCILGRSWCWRPWLRRWSGWEDEDEDENKQGIGTIRYLSSYDSKASALGKERENQDASN